MKTLFLTALLLHLSLSSVAQEVEHKKKPSHEWLDRFKAAPIGWSQFLTPESTTNEFHKYVSEVFESSGEIREGTERWKLFAVDLMAVFLAEHYQLRGLAIDAVIEKYGKPTAVYRVRGDSQLFQLFIQSSLICPPTDEPLICFVYNDRYVWIIVSVLGISPRSERFDKYVKKQFKSEIH